MSFDKKCAEKAIETCVLYNLPLTPYPSLKVHHIFCIKLSVKSERRFHFLSAALGQT